MRAFVLDFTTSRPWCLWCRPPGVFASVRRSLGTRRPRRSETTRWSRGGCLLCVRPDVFAGLGSRL